MGAGMMLARRRLVAGGAALVAVAALAGLAPGAGAITPVTPKPPEHPSVYFERATKAWAAGDREVAVFWFYLAQLRYRARLAAHPELEASSEPALFAALMESVGRPINEYAFGNVAELSATIDRVLRWDDGQPDDAIPKAIRERVRDGLAGLRDTMRREAETIRAERRKNGLENR
jgi:hypothetical protein